MFACCSRQSTAIPASNFSDSLKSGVKNLEESSKKVRGHSERACLADSGCSAWREAGRTDSLARSLVCDLLRPRSQVYYDVAGKPYLTCGKCAAHVTVAKKDVKSGAGGSPKAPVAEGQGLGSPPNAGAEAAAAAPGGLQAPPAAHEGVYQGETVICPSCKNPIEGAHQ